MRAVAKLVEPQTPGAIGRVALVKGTQTIWREIPVQPVASAYNDPNGDALLLVLKGAPKALPWGAYVAKLF